MKYNCKECDFEIEGESKIISVILEHEKTHPHEEAEMKDDGSKPACSFCGCKVDHNIDLNAIDACGFPFKHVTYVDGTNMPLEDN